MVRVACESEDFQKEISQLACGPLFFQQVVKRETSNRVGSYLTKYQADQNYLLESRLPLKSGRALVSFPPGHGRENALFPREK